MKYMFDTNAFNDFLDDHNFPDVSNVQIYATHIQIQEINKTRDEARKEALLKIFREITDKKVQSESKVFPITFGEQKFGDGTYKEIKEALDKEVADLKPSVRKKKEKSHINDAQIAETALKNECILVTTDAEIISVFPKFGGRVETYKEFIRSEEL